MVKMSSNCMFVLFPSCYHGSDSLNEWFNTVWILYWFISVLFHLKKKTEKSKEYLEGLFVSTDS